MGLADQMRHTEELMRRPGQLGALVSAGGDDGAVLATIDAGRLAAVAANHARHVVDRWWGRRFSGTTRALDAVARELVASDRFCEAVGEDVTAAAIVHATLDRLDADEELAAARVWLPELLAWEYLLAVGLPRRAASEAIDEAVEARVLEGRGSLLTGGRLARPVGVLSIRWPLGDLQDDPALEVEPLDEPETRVFFMAEAVPGEVAPVLEVGAADQLADAVSLLAAGASDATLGEAFGEDAAEAASFLRAHGLIAG